MASKFTKTIIAGILTIALLLILALPIIAHGEEQAAQPAGGGLSKWWSGVKEKIGKTVDQILQQIHIKPAVPAPASIAPAIPSIDGILYEVKTNPATASLITEQPTGTYRISISTSNMETLESLQTPPFRSSMVYDPSNSKWYAITINTDSATISDSVVLPAPQYYLYPTTGQIGDVEQLVTKALQQGELSTSDEITLTTLWLTLKKTGGS